MISGVLLLNVAFAVAFNFDDFTINQPVPDGTSNSAPPNDRTIYNQSLCGVRNGFYHNRIVHGQLALKGEFPWLVSIQIRQENSFRHVCGGAIVHPYWIISAGHCVFDLNATDLYAVAGEHNLYKVEGFEQRRRVSFSIINGFDMSNFQNDISLLKLQSPFDFNTNVSAICVPKTEEFTGYATAAGWGRLEENNKLPHVVRRVALPIVNKTICEDKYKIIGFSRYLHECQMCAGYVNGGKDACQGDSGGPLMCKDDVDDRYYVCGIISWGIGCARAAYPGIYTKVTCFSDWVRETIRSH